MGDARLHSGWPGPAGDSEYLYVMPVSTHDGQALKVTPVLTYDGWALPGATIRIETTGPCRQPTVLP